jgi:hypothetical protein
MVNKIKAMIAVAPSKATTGLAAPVGNGGTSHHQGDQ